MEGVNSEAVGLTGDVTVRLIDGNIRALQDLAGPAGADLFSFQKGLGVHMQHACNIEAADQTDTLASINLPEQGPVTCGTKTQFLLADGSYKAAADLRQGDVLAGRFEPVTLAADAVVGKLNTPAQCFQLSVHGVGNFALACGLFVKSQNVNWA